MSKKFNKQQQTQQTAHPNPVTRQNKSITSGRGVSSMTNWLVVLVVVLPFLHSGILIEPVIPPRYLFLGIFLLLFAIFFFFVYKKKSPAEIPLNLKLIFLLCLAYIFWSLIGTYTAINPREGYYFIGRQALYVVLLFVVVFTVIGEQHQLLKIAKALVIVGILQSFVGMAQFYQAGFLELPGNFYPYGLMANRNLFGSAQVLLIPFCLMVLQLGSRNWKFIAAISLLGLIISVFISQTRSSWIAATFIFIISLVLISIFSPSSRRSWLKAYGIGFIVSAIVLSLVFLSNQDEAFTSSIRERAASLTLNAADSSAETGNVQERIKIWKKTLQLVKNNPVTGVGAGNWRVAIPALGTTGLIWEDGYYVPDQPHNDYLLIASESGVPGAILFFGSWLFIVILGFKILRASASQETKIITILMLAGMAAFASDSFFSFPDARMEHKLYFTLMCGIICGLYYHVIKTEKPKEKILPAWVTGAAVGIAAFNIFIGIVRYNFEIHMYRARSFDKAGQYADVLKEAKAAKNNFITLDAIGKPAEIYSSIGYKETKNFKLALLETELAKKYNPNRAMNYNNIATIFMDMQDYEKALKYCLVAVNMTPKFEIALKNLSSIYFQLKKYPECIETLNKIQWQSDQYLVSLYNYASRQVSVNSPTTTPVQ